MKKLIGYLILLPTIALSCLGNFGLYGTPALGVHPRNIVVLLVAFGIECSLVILTHEAAARAKNVEDGVRAFTLGLMLMLLALSATGQYAFLLKGAVGHEIALVDATDTRADVQDSRERLRAEQDQIMQALSKEQKTGWGPNAATLSGRLDTVKQQLMELDSKKEKATAVVTDTSEFLVACSEFDLPLKGTVKVAVGLFVLVANITAFWLLFLSYLEAADAKAKASELVTAIRMPYQELERNVEQPQGREYPPAPAAPRTATPFQAVTSPPPSQPTARPRSVFHQPSEGHQ